MLGQVVSSDRKGGTAAAVGKKQWRCDDQEGEISFHQA